MSQCLRNIFGIQFQFSYAFQNTFTVVYGVVQLMTQIPSTSLAEGWLFPFSCLSSHKTQWLSVLLGKETLHRTSVNELLLKTTRKLLLYQSLFMKFMQMVNLKAQSLKSVFHLFFRTVNWSHHKQSYIRIRLGLNFNPIKNTDACAFSNQKSNTHITGKNISPVLHIVRVSLHSTIKFQCQISEETFGLQNMGIQKPVSFSCTADFL